MNTSHLISQCAWQTAFDQESAAHELQNFISRWSNTVLTEVLEQCFDELCPPAQTWRIATLDLDLGDILFDDLAHELPTRLKASLHTAMARMLAREQISVSSNDDGNLRIMDHAQSMQEFVSWFVQNGTVPWWFSGTESALQILDRQLAQAPSATIEIIRQLGRSERVRQRLVWQLGEVRIRRIIHLLEPWQGDFICAFADNFFVLQAARQLPPSNPSAFRECTWLTILKHILVDRGSLFNTATFVRANLVQVAQRYQINYRELLGQMFQALAELESSGLITLTFFSAIKTIYQQDRVSILKQSVKPAMPQAPWLALQKMLHYGLKSQTLGVDRLNIDELFVVLARQDTKRMARMLLLEGQSLKTRQGILKHFAVSELSLLVQVLEPQEHTFILVHVQQTQTQVEKLHWQKETVWQILLAYLFSAGSSQFNRRQLVHETLLELCKLHGFELAVFLDLLIHSVQTEHPNQQHFKLLAIFKDLKSAQARRHRASEIKQCYWQAALQYLKTGKNSGFIRPAAIPRQQILDGLLCNSAEQSLAQLLSASELHTTSNELLSLRLLTLVGAADLSLLVNLLEPGATRFCESLIEGLLFWQKRVGLSALDGVDLAHRIPALLIQALPGFYLSRQGGKSGFDLATYWRGFVALLKQKCGVNISAFYQQIEKCLVQDLYLHGVNAKSILGLTLNDNSIQYLSDSLLPLIQARRKRPSLKPGARHVLTPPKSSHNVSSVVVGTRWTKVQLFSALRNRLSPKDVGSTDPLPQALDSVPLTVLWRQIEREGMHVISDWLGRQPDKYALLKILSLKRDIQPIGYWLSERLPDELKPAEETIKHWATLLQKTGHWQGASAVLEKQLAEIFWAVSFDARAHNLSASELLAKMVFCACLRLNIRLSDCLEDFKNQKQYFQNIHWSNAYKVLIVSAPQKMKKGSQLSEQPNNSIPVLVKKDRAGVITDFRQDFLAEYLNHPRFIAIARCLLQKGQPPAWLKCAQPLDLSRLLFDVFTVKPTLLKALLGDLQQQHGVMFRLLNIVPLACLIDAMSVAESNKQAKVLLLEKFAQWLEKIDIPHSSAKPRRAILFQLILKHWLNNDWTALAPDKLVGNFLYQLMRQQHIDKAVLQTAFAPHLQELPESLRLAITKVINNTDAPSEKNLTNVNVSNETGGPATHLAEAIAKANLAAVHPHTSTTPMRITNAGLVILQGFISLLFPRLGLVENNQFVTPDAQRRAVHFLQFLVTGCTETAEEHLLLNKLLCGLALHDPVEIGIEISAAEVDICHSLLNSVIGYWEAIGSSSVDGCRGDWLVRDGSLADAKDHWDLVVDRRAYDLLLAKAPFSYSVIKLPWMEKAIYVTWPT